jgi:flagellar protein FliJ
MARFKLAGVLRARQAQESVAKAAAARSRAEAQAAEAEVHRYEATLDAAYDVCPRTATALVASLTARQAMATALYAAVGLAREADVLVETRMADLAVAAGQRQALDRLAERHAVTVRLAAEAAERREVDDLTAARFVAAQRVSGGDSA